jgi:hypothetical protein
LRIYQEAIRKKYFWSAHKYTSCTSGVVHDQILFLLYINDLPINIQMAETVLFVDDADILVEAASEHILNHKINKVPTDFLIWFDGNRLVINTSQNRSF